nr:PLP-dependent transferase [Saprospiraceae bacterium]
LPLRMKKHSKNTKKIIAFLESHPMVRKIIYPGIPSFEQYELGKKQMSGYSGLLSFELNTDDISTVKSFINALKLINWEFHGSGTKASCTLLPSATQRN